MLRENPRLPPRELGHVRHRKTREKVHHQDSEAGSNLEAKQLWYKDHPAAQTVELSGKLKFDWRFLEDRH